MNALLERVEQALPVSKLSRNVKEVLDNLDEVGHYVVMRNNAPAGVLVSVDEFQMILDQLEDALVEAQLADRVAKMEATGEKPRLFSIDEVRDMLKQRG